MKFKIEFLNTLSLLKINLKRNFLKEFVLGSGVIIATILMILSVVISDGIEKLFKNSTLGNIPREQIKIIAPSNDNLISLSNIKEIKKTNFIEDVNPIYKATFPITAWFEVPQTKNENSMRLFVEPEVVAIPNDMAMEQLNKQSELFKRNFNNNFPDGFKKNSLNRVPILITSFVQNYTSNYSKVNKLTLGNLIGMPIELSMGSSHTNNSYDEDSDNQLHCVVVGFIHPYISSGVVIPMEEMQKFRKKFLSFKNQLGYEAAYIKVKHVEYVDDVQKKLEKKITEWGYAYDTGLEDFKVLAGIISTGIRIFDKALLTLSGIILLLSMIAIFYAFLYIVIRREKEIGLFRFFGATRKKIIILFLSEATMVGLLCALIGIVFAYFFTSLLPSFEQIKSLFSEDLLIKLFPEGKEIPEEANVIFKFDFFQALLIGLITSLCSIISSFIPTIVGTYNSFYRAFKQFK